jgi:predicted nucleic acid-binding protein
MSHLLDTSALLAHAFHESGGEHVQSLFDDEDASIGVSVLTLYECDGCLRRQGLKESQRRKFIAGYKALLDKVHPVDEKVCAAAMEIREAAEKRIATVDILIAATAKLLNATLVHRDSHFAAIPATHLKQHFLPEKLA